MVCDSLYYIQITLDKLLTQENSFRHVVKRQRERENTMGLGLQLPYLVQKYIKYYEFDMSTTLIIQIIPTYN